MSLLLSGTVVLVCVLLVSDGELVIAAVKSNKYVVNKCFIALSIEKENKGDNKKRGIKSNTSNHFEVEQKNMRH